MPKITVTENVSVPKVTTSESVSVKQVTLSESSELPNRIGLNGKSPYVGENGNWFAFNDSSREYYDTGIAATDENFIADLESMKARMSNVETSINEILQRPDDILVFHTYLLFPNVGNESTLYIDRSQNKSYRWDALALKYYILNDESFEIINGGN